MYLDRDDLLVKGRGDINLPQFPKPKQYREYGKTVFEALGTWTQNLMSVNATGNVLGKYHRHKVPEQLILPADAGAPLVVIRSLKRAMRIAEDYEPNSNYRQTGYFVPLASVSQENEISISVAPNALATDFTPLFKRTGYSNAYRSGSSYVIEDETWHEDYRSSWGSSRAEYTDALERKLRPKVKGILNLLGYDESAFLGDGVVTVHDYEEQVCEAFDCHY